jgi:hypothetical protein
MTGNNGVHIMFTTARDFLLESSRFTETAAAKTGLNAFEIKPHCDQVILEFITFDVLN